jgi:hypothetical protein
LVQKTPPAAAKRTSRTPSKREQEEAAREADAKPVGPMTAPVVRKVKRKKKKARR